MTAGTYANPTKARYRKHVLGYFGVIEKRCRRRGQPSGTALIMPGPLDAEISRWTLGGQKQIALPVGHLHVVDSNPAIVATHRRKYHDLGGTYGTTVGRAFETVAQRGLRFRYFHLDFKSNLSPALASELQVPIAICDNPCVVAVNVLRGREGPRSNLYLPGFDSLGRIFDSHYTHDGFELNRLDYSRLGQIWLELNQSYIRSGYGLDFFYFIRAGTYLSEDGGQTMLWSMWGRGRPVKHGRTPQATGGDFRIGTSAIQQLQSFTWLMSGRDSMRVSA